MKMEDCTVEENVQIAKDTYKMKIKGNFVKECRTPGQFVNIRIGDGREYMLRRPISISEIDRGENLVTIIYRIVGEGTKFMADIKKGNEIDIMGPLGRGYDVLSLQKEQTALLVGGGIGVPPLYELAKQFNQRGIKTIAILGFNTKDEVFYEEEFKKFGETYVSTVDGSFKRQLASALAYTKDAETLARILESLKNKDVVKPQDLAMSWYFPLLNHQFTQATAWTWARENWDWIKAALGGDMSFDKFVIYPANAFKTAERLAEYKAFFEPQLDDMAISRNISMGIKEIAARVALIAREKAAVEKAIKASV